MKHFVIIAVLVFFVLKTFGSTLQDSVSIDKNKAARIIDTIKEKQEPRNYYIFDKNYSSKDITYSYPTKVIEKTFDIQIKWKNTVIYEYVIDLLTYEIKMVTDLR